MTAPKSAPPDGATEPVVPKNIRWVLLGIMLALLLSQLDGLIVGTAMPTIVNEIGGVNSLSWVVTAYTLTTACSTPVWGKLGDLYNRKTMFLASIAVFLAASALCGMASTMNELIIFRALQGIGAGGLGAGAFALIGALLPPRERGRYQGMVAIVMAVGSIGGPLTGGAITGHLGWRWAFYINLPIGLICIAWCQLLLHVPHTRRSKVVIDWLGITLMTAMVSTIVMAATWAGSTYAWGSWQILTLATASVVLFAAFVASQRRSTEPLLPPRIFTGSRNFSLAAVLLVVAGVAMFGGTLYLPLYQQTVQDASATNSGLLLLPMMIGTVIASNIAGKVMTKTGHYKVFPIIGAVSLTIGMALLSSMDTHTSPTVTSAFMVLVGIGTGFTLQMANTIAQNSVELRDIGAASASTNLFRTLGGSLGVAVFGSLFTRAVQGRAPAGGAPGDGAHSGDSALAHLPQAAKDAYLQAVVHGTHQIFLVASIVAAAGLGAAVFIREVPLRGKPGGAQAAPGPKVQAAAN
ncbi:MDR family MFS transporter [Streptantibioticus ferralitis]|uniref:MDR family MFS transporter n=1 Tax=Streptantibioticus ferralitis TaxID=236510 RepID=A0ABT5ZDN1_9ACTN|nr:MDR family MFS transporter [Streptantibioticus ferralitis]MDF2261150.1 MDR family MFS transporter [Streptantibioticus ferralitis]